MKVGPSKSQKEREVVEMTEPAKPARWTTSEWEIDPQVERALVFAALNLRGLLLQVLYKLTPAEEETLFRRFQEKRSVDETRSLMKRTRSQVRQLEQRVLRKLQNRILEVLNDRAVRRQQLAQAARGPLAD